jgi:hypothetical protein
MVENNQAGPPEYAGLPDRDRRGLDWADNYVQRLSTWFVPPTTGRYVFYLSSDDDSDLFLSTDENEANKRLIAQQSFVERHPCLAVRATMSRNATRTRSWPRTGACPARAASR